MTKKPSLLEIKQKIGRFCAFRERSPKEVQDKLASWNVPALEAEEVMRMLLEDNYLNEQRFANAFCHDKFEFNSWGKQKIKSHIYQHQLSVDVIEEALKRIDPDKYFERLQVLIQKKWDSLSVEDKQKRKQKVVAYAVSKGFEVDLIWKVLNNF